MQPETPLAALTTRPPAGPKRSMAAKEMAKPSDIEPTSSSRRERMRRILRPPAKMASTRNSTSSHIGAAARGSGAIAAPTMVNAPNSHTATTYNCALRGRLRILELLPKPTGLDALYAEPCSKRVIPHPPVQLTAKWSGVLDSRPQERAARVA